MKPMAIIGVVLIAVGILAFVSGGITYTTREKVFDVGPFRATAERKKTVPLPRVLGGVCLVAGVVLVISGRGKR
jgi:uncharacterized membrane protein HdeD (DUF308 family)